MPPATVGCRDPSIFAAHHVCGLLALHFVLRHYGKVADLGRYKHNTATFKMFYISLRVPCTVYHRRLGIRRGSKKLRHILAGPLFVTATTTIGPVPQTLGKFSLPSVVTSSAFMLRNSTNSEKRTLQLPNSMRIGRNVRHENTGFDLSLFARLQTSLYAKHEQRPTPTGVSVLMMQLAVDCHQTFSVERNR